MTFDKSKQVPCIAFVAEPIAQRDSDASCDHAREPCRDDMNNKKWVHVRELEVSLFYKITCPKHKADLKRVSVIECAYYKCLASGNNRAVFDEYVALPRLRDPSWRPEDTFCNFMNLVENIQKCGFDSGKGEPLTVWIGTNWLWRGQHRAAALLWINQDYLVEVKEEKSPPTDHNLCSNPCS